VAELAKRHRNDNVQFAWLKAQKQPDFVQVRVKGRGRGRARVKP
jgi:hypothetical protein